jgi:hypothetical protein
MAEMHPSSTGARARPRDLLEEVEEIRERVGQPIPFPDREDIAGAQGSCSSPFETRAGPLTTGGAPCIKVLP